MSQDFLRTNAAAARRCLGTSSRTSSTSFASHPRSLHICHQEDSGSLVECRLFVSPTLSAAIFTTMSRGALRN